MWGAGIGRTKVGTIWKERLFKDGRRVEERIVDGEKESLL